MRYFLIILLVGSAALPARAQGWAEAEPLNVARRDAAVAVLNGEMYVIGGRDAAGNPLDSVERYTADGSADVAPLRDSRSGASAVAYQGRIVVIGGRENDGEATDGAEVYVPDRERWESFPSMKESRHGLGAAVLQGRIYALGGATEGDVLLPSCEYYDSAVDDWLPYPYWGLDPQRAAFGVAVVDTFAYFGGGFGVFGPSDIMQRYSLPRTESEAGRTTETLEPMPTARGGLAFASDGRAIYAIGGLDADSRVLDVVERYDLQRGVWEPFVPLQTARVGAVAGFIGGTLYVAAGRDEFGNVLNSVEVLQMPLSAEADVVTPVNSLDAAFPNPFTDKTTFSVRLETAGPISLRVYDVRGREVARLLESRFAVGTHPVIWDGRGSNGEPLPNGLYIARLVAGGHVSTTRVTMLSR